MKNRGIYKYISRVLYGFSALLLLPIIVSIIYSENPIPFIIPLLISFLIGIILDIISKKDSNLYAKDGFIIVSLSWIIISLISAIPFVLSLNLSFDNAWFEAVSGLTTTGATIFKDVEHLPHNILFWRSFMHFIGGMGVLTFVMAIVPLSKKDKSMYVLKAEMPGPTVSKLVPSLKKTLFYLYGIYIFLTVSEIVLLLLGKTPLFDSLLISFGTAGTGGFALHNTSIATYTDMAKWVVAIFMLLFGINFNIYFLMLMKDFKNIFKSEELRVYLLMYIFAVTFVIINTIDKFTSTYEAILNGVFHVSSLMTSTGYSIGNINIYPTNCKVLILLLMLISACAGSTCGGFKISRLIICFKKIKMDILRLVHPNMVKEIRFEGKRLTDSEIDSVTSFLLLYVVLIIIAMFLVSFDPINLSLSEVINATFTTFANVGLCFEISNFSAFSCLSKVVLSIGMLLGRLELIPLIIMITHIRK